MKELLRHVDIPSVVHPSVQSLFITHRHPGQSTVHSALPVLPGRIELGRFICTSCSNLSHQTGRSASPAEKGLLDPYLMHILCEFGLLRR
jgi:hypothetical protein